MDIREKFPKLMGFENPDEKTAAFLEKTGIDTAQIVAAARVDLTLSGAYGEMWLFAMENGFAVADEKTGYYCFYPFDQYRIKIENYVATGVILAVCGERETVAASFTSSCASSAGNICRICERLADKKEITEEDFKRGEDDRVCPKCGTPYKKGKKTCPKCQNKRKLFVRVLGYMPRYKKELALVMGLIVLESLIGLLRPFLNGSTLYDEVLTAGGRYYGKIVEFVLLMIALEITSLTVNIIKGRVGAVVSGKIVYDIKSEIFDAMQRLSMSFFNSKHTGSLMNRVNSDALDIQYFLNDGMPSFLINAITILGIGTAVFVSSPVLALLIMLPVPVIVLVIKKVVPKFRKFKWIGWHKSSRLNSIINDSLLGVRVVKAFGKEQREVNRFEEATMDLYDVRVKEGLMSARIFPALNYLMTIGGLFVWGYGGNQVLKGNMTFGTLMTFVGYVGMLYAPINFMIRTYDWWTDCMNSAQRIFEIIDRRTDVPEAKDPVEIGRLKGEVELRDVTFAYEANKNVLHNVSFHIKPGEMIGLVGHSGAGKSTVINLLMRLYKADEGDIKIDGNSIEDYSVTDYKNHIGVVLQESYLFSGSIINNIRYARPDASDDECIRAAKIANAHEFIINLPDGYDTYVGEKGQRLSGGERQRISIARAVLSDPKIMILDEATASVDTETEQQIQQALGRIIKGRTTFAIAHRLSTLKNANRLVVLEEGRIAEVGSHNELMEKDGIYAALVKAQRTMTQLSVTIDDAPHGGRPMGPPPGRPPH